MTEPVLEMPDDLVSAEAWRQLENVYDPELGVNLVDLGLIYAIEVRSARVRAGIPLPPPAGPWRDPIPTRAHRACLLIPAASQEGFDMVWGPPGDPEM